MKPSPLLAIALLTIAITSCNSPRYIYSSSPPNAAYLKQKGDSKLAAYYSSGTHQTSPEDQDGYNRGLDVQGAYAVTDHWAVTASFFSRKERDAYDDSRISLFNKSTVNYRRNLFDIGGGYFTTIEQSKTIGVSLFGGIGWGKFRMQDAGLTETLDPYDRFHHSKIRKIYVQPALTIMPGEYFRMMIVHRFSFVHFGDISTNYTIDEREYFRLTAVENRTRYFGETTIGAQCALPGTPWMSIEASTTFSTQPGIDYNRIRARGFNSSIGLSFDISKMLRK
jgi:hypothetical protein